MLNVDTRMAATIGGIIFGCAFSAVAWKLKDNPKWLQGKTRQDSIKASVVGLIIAAACTIVLIGKLLA